MVKLGMQTSQEDKKKKKKYKKGVCVAHKEEVEKAKVAHRPPTKCRFEPSTRNKKPRPRHAAAVLDALQWNKNTKLLPGSPSCNRHFLTLWVVVVRTS
jgi:hypothetical protein